MKRISILSISAVLIMAACGESMAASGLVSSGNSANKGAITARASSLRLGGTTRQPSLKGKTLKSLETKKTTIGDETQTRTASVSRNSLGRHIGASREQSVSMAALPSPLFDQIQQVDDRVTVVDDRVTAVADRVTNVEDTKQDKVTGATADNIATFDGTGQTQDSGKYFTNATISADSTDSEIPTSGAIYSFVTSQDYATNTDITNAIDTARQEINTELTNYVRAENITEGATNGTIAVNGTDVPVHGLGTAAYTDATAYATANDLVNFATTTDLNAVQATAEAAQQTASTALQPGALDDYATQEWVQNQGYLTGHQSLDGYATQEWVQDQGYLTGQDLDSRGFATQEWVNNQHYLVADDISGLQPESEKDRDVAANSVDWSDTDKYPSMKSVATKVADATNDMATQTWVNNQLANYATNDNVTNLATSAATAATTVALSNYTTTEDTRAAITAEWDRAEAWIGRELGYNTTTTDVADVLHDAGFTADSIVGALIELKNELHP